MAVKGYGGVDGLLGQRNAMCLTLGVGDPCGRIWFRKLAQALKNETLRFAALQL